MMKTTDPTANYGSARTLADLNTNNPIKHSKSSYSTVAVKVFKVAASPCVRVTSSSSNIMVVLCIQ